MEDSNNKKLNPKMESHKFKKGQTPWNKGKKKVVAEDKKATPTVEKKEDKVAPVQLVKPTASVSFVLVRPKPIAKKEFEGKLEDEKEKEAVHFLRSVISNNPRSITIDRVSYFNEGVVKSLIFGYDKMKERMQEAQREEAKAEEARKEAVDNAIVWRGIYEKTKLRMILWRSLAIGAIAGFLGSVCVTVITDHTVKANKSAAQPVVEVATPNT